MLKVIRFDKSEYVGERYNNALNINNALAVARGMAVLKCIPKRRAYRKHIMRLCNERPNLPFRVSQKDIKRLECAARCELPVNVIDILEVLVSEIQGAKDKIKYRAQDNYIISFHILNQTLNTLEDFRRWLAGHNIGERPMDDKYRDGVDYVKRRLDEFNKQNQGEFNSLFE